MKGWLICKLNDEFRNTLTGGKIILTNGVKALSLKRQLDIQAAVKSFDRFDDENDPFNEHDYGAVQVAEFSVFFKIDCYDSSIENASPNPCDPKVTTRVLTIGLMPEFWAHKPSFDEFMQSEENTEEVIYFSEIDIEFLS
jgi:hypothetical protein